ncbi:MAG: RNA polymerase sigma factor [Planctomycetes bacterium]|nr:RNA polymerase sigma factor [Planctomycetota bacterium]
MTDGELVRRVVAGDSAAYGELARRWFRRILVLCQAKVFTHDAEDLAQDALVRGYSRLSSLSNPEQFGPWLRSIANHLCADWCRDRMRHRETDCAWVDLAIPLPSLDSTLAADERAIVVQQVASIPEDLREVILLRYYEDLSYDEMAQWLGVARATVNERLAKARALLRIRLAKLRSDV